MVRPEQGPGVPGRERLDPVDQLAAGVEPLADSALGVLVRQPVAHGQQHRGRGVVLRGNQLELLALRGQLAGDGDRHIGLGRRDDFERGGVGGPGRINADRSINWTVHGRAPSGGIGSSPRRAALPGFSGGPLHGGAPPERQSRPVTTVVRPFGTGQPVSTIVKQARVAKAGEAATAVTGVPRPGHQRLTEPT